MARYRAEMTTDATPDTAFAYLADFASAVEWDPGVVESGRLTDGAPHVGSRFSIVSSFLGRHVPLVYEITGIDHGRRVELVAENKQVRSHDTITFATVEGATRVVYDAELTLKGVFKVFEPLMRVAFGRIGNQATSGLRYALAELDQATR